MATWTYQDNWDLLPNINVRGAYADGVLMKYNLYPASGYVLHIPSLDEPVLDDWGEPTGEIRPYYTWGGAMEFLNYDFEANPKGYVAVLYEEGMTVNGGGNTQPPHEIA